MSDQASQPRFFAEVAAEIGRTTLDGATALQLLHEAGRLDQIPESERAAWTAQQHQDAAAGRIATQTFAAKRLAINRANAQFSTGPRTLEGLFRSSLNAQKHGLTGRSCLVASDSAGQFEQHCHDMQSFWQPVGPEELAILNEMADARWRLARVPRLEAALYAKGRMQFREQMTDIDFELQGDLTDLETYLHYQSEFKNLHLQEGRLRRTYDKLEKRLEKLQTERQQQEAEQITQQQQAAAKAQAEEKAANAGSESAATQRPPEASAVVQPPATQLPGFVFSDAAAVAKSEASGRSQSDTVATPSKLS